MTRLLMLDSGAFSVWTKGESVDLDSYISFCCQHPDVTYYVNLDVIPGKFGDKRSLRDKSVNEAACKQGWRNYRRMIAELPMDKVIPVFHQNDDPRWLVRYLEFGVKYIGISPANDATTKSMDYQAPTKTRWLSTLRHLLFDGAGRPVVRTHGFAATSYDLMKFWQWYSVDSTSWKMASWGGVYVPQQTGGCNDYSKPPVVVATTPRSPRAKDRGCHLSNVSPVFRERILAYLDERGIGVGEYRIIQVGDGHKLGANQLWHDKGKREVIEEIVPGVVTSLRCRYKVNIGFVKQANLVLPVDHIYFAGGIIAGDLEFRMGRRLLAYPLIADGNSRFLRHCRLVRKSNVESNKS